MLLKQYRPYYGNMNMSRHEVIKNFNTEGSKKALKQYYSFHSLEFHKRLDTKAIDLFEWKSFIYSKDLSQGFFRILELGSSAAAIPHTPPHLIRHVWR